LSPARRKRRRVLVAVLGVCLTAGGVATIALVRTFLNGAPPQPKKVVQEIHVIRPPPPPPDLPPPPPPPPEEKVTEVDQPRPDPNPSNEPPPSEQLGLDAEGSAGGDAFGLLGNKGGRDLLGSGGSAAAWYGGVIKDALLELLGNDKMARSGQYSVDVKIWVREDGTVERWRIVHSSGNPEKDRAIENALSHLTRIPQPPPAEVPQPIVMRIVSHG